MAAPVMLSDIRTLRIIVDGNICPDTTKEEKESRKDLLCCRQLDTIVVDLACDDHRPSSVTAWIGQNILPLIGISQRPKLKVHSTVLLEAILEHETICHVMHEVSDGK